MPEAVSSPGAVVVRLHPIRTLVIARDLAFRQRAATVLGELGEVGFAVASPDLIDQVMTLIERERPSVVVLDATGCGFDVAAVVYELSHLVPRLGVVVVRDQRDRATYGPAINKWGWAEELAQAVMNAYHSGNPRKEEQADVSLGPS